MGIGQVLASGERDCDMRCSGGGWDGWDGRHDKLQRLRHALKRLRDGMVGMGFMAGWRKVRERYIA